MFDHSPIILGFLGILCGAAIVAACHFAAISWCSRRHVDHQPRPNHAQQGAQLGQEASTSSTGSYRTTQLLKVYIYGKEWKEGTCAVCLSVFMEGEEVRILPGCEHAFHVPCIDMWLYLHPSCPLCRNGTMPLVKHIVVSLPSSNEFPPIVDEPLPSLAGLPSPVHNQTSEL